MAPIIYRSQTDVARWCGVQGPAVSNWVRRYEGRYPEPDGVVMTEGQGVVIRGWLPGRKPEWVAFAESLRKPPGAVTRARRTADMIAAGVNDGTIDPAYAVKLLHELIGGQPEGETTEGGADHGFRRRNRPG